MAVKITYFVHGTTEDNENELSSGWNDAKLSELGKIQSKELLEKTKHLRFSVVFTSDLARAVESAKLTWGDTYEIIRDKRLRECNYGDFNGRPSRQVEPLQEKSVKRPMPGGESYEMVKKRMQDFIDDLKVSYDGKHIAIVAHKAPQLALDVLLKDMSWEQAFKNDWRNTKNWQPGWAYELK